MREYRLTPEEAKAFASLDLEMTTMMVNLQTRLQAMMHLIACQQHLEGSWDRKGDVLKRVDAEPT